MHELWRGMANAWECDELGHLNVRAYVDKMTEGFAGLLGALDQPSAERAGATSQIRVREMHVRFLAEARPGDRLDVEGGITALADAELTAAMVMRHHDDGRAAAGALIRAEHVSPGAGRPFRWPSRLRARAEDWVIAAPEESEPRAIALDPPVHDAELARADALELAEIGRGVFRREEADAYDAVRPAAMMGRLSDGAGRLFAPMIAAMPDRRLGPALLEVRFIWRGAPRAGDRFVIRSGLVAAGENDKLMRAAHWILDPQTGRPWCTSEGVAALLDLDARKLTPLSAKAGKAAKGLLRPTLRA